MTNVATKSDEIAYPTNETNGMEIISAPNTHMFDLDVKISPYSSLYKFFEEKCIQHPNSKYIWYLNEWFTYNQVKGFVDRCAAGLEHLKIPPKTLIAIQLPNSLEFIITLLACNKLHLPVILLNPNYKATEIYHVLSRSKAKVYVGLNIRYQEEFPNFPEPTPIELLILTNLGEITPTMRTTPEYQRVSQFFRNPATLQIPRESIPFYLLFEEHLVTEIKGRIKWPIFTKFASPSRTIKINSSSNPAIMIEAYNINGQEQLNIFTHEAILAQLFQLEHTFITSHNPQHQNLSTESDKKDRFWGFLGIQPFSTSFGYISNIYLPMLFESYTIILPDAPKSVDFFKILAHIPIQNGLVLIGSAIIFERLLYYKHILAHRSFLEQYFKCNIVCHHPVTESFQQEFFKKLGVHLLNSYGSLDHPFIALQYPRKSPHHTQNIRKLTMEMQLLPYTTLATNNGKVFNIKGPQQVTHINNNNLNQSWIPTQDDIQIDPLNFVQIREQNAFIVINNGFKILLSHVEHLYSYYEGIIHASIDRGQFLLHRLKKNALGKARFIAKTIIKHPSFEIDVEVSHPSLFSRKKFVAWCQNTMAFYKCPQKVIVSEKTHFITPKDHIAHAQNLAKGDRISEGIETPQVETTPEINPLEQQFLDLQNVVITLDTAEEWKMGLSICDKIIGLGYKLGKFNEIKTYRKKQTYFKAKMKEKQLEYVKSNLDRLVHNIIYIKTDLDIFRNIKVEDYVPEQLEIKDYLTLLREANDFETMEPQLCRDRLLQCMAIIKNDPATFLLTYPNRIEDRIILESRIPQLIGREGLEKRSTIKFSIDSKIDYSN